MEKFAFSFQRTMNDTKPKKPNIEDFTKFLFKQDTVISKINEITEMGVETAHDVFLSKYRFGDFLSPHSDKNNGRVAFVLNMTKNWKPHFGGVLHIMNQERTEIVKSVSPAYNSLVLFHIPEDTGIPHFVSHINVHGRYRYAVTGWFS
jgi:Rps23 Pro-64 3,4-dihydroxylase Tpa1-like proline 4-hydroxylase